jgi:hypothetical protein
MQTNTNTISVKATRRRARLAELLAAASLREGLAEGRAELEAPEARRVSEGLALALTLAEAKGWPLALAASAAAVALDFCTLEADALDRRIFAAQVEL